MSILGKLANTIEKTNKPTNMFDRSLNSKLFTEKYPVITEYLTTQDILQSPCDELIHHYGHNGNINVFNQIRKPQV